MVRNSLQVEDLLLFAFIVSVVFRTVTGLSSVNSRSERSASFSVKDVSSYSVRYLGRVHAGTSLFGVATCTKTSANYRCFVVSICPTKYSNTIRIDILAT